MSILPRTATVSFDARHLAFALIELGTIIGRPGSMEHFSRGVEVGEIVSSHRDIWRPWLFESNDIVKRIVHWLEEGNVDGILRDTHMRYCRISVSPVATFVEERRKR